MGLIGDIYYSFRGDGARLQKDAQVEGAKAGTGLGNSMAASLKKSWSGAEIGKGFIQGLGLAGGLGAFTLISGAVSKFTDVLGESIQQALADEESQNRLKASLKANVPAWNGNTDAIEANIKSKQRLAFDDETLRDSLTVLVGATHDVTKAQEIQNTAMDLARFKGISLRDASEALIKVEAGQYRSLKQLGIKLRDGATQTEALAAVQAVAAGQAEAYAQTNKGKLEASQIALSEAMETFGYTVMPTVIDAMVGGSKAAVGLAGTLDLLQEGVAKTTDGQQQQLQSVIDLQKAIAFLMPFYGGLADAEQGMLDQSIETSKVFDSTTKDMDQSAANVASGIKVSMDKAGDAAVDFRDRFKDASGAVGRAAGRLRTSLAGIAQGIIDDFYNPIEKRAELHDIRLQLLADRETLRTAKTKEEKRQAKDDIVKDLHDEASALTALGDTGDLTAADVKKFASDARSQYGTMSKDAIAKTEAIIKKLQALAGLHPKPVVVPVILDLKVSAADRAAWTSLTHHAWGHGPLLAEGGPVKKGMPYIVGDGGRPELFVPDTNGVVLPRVPSSIASPAASAGGGGNTINVQLPVTARPDPFETADALRRLNDFGVLSVGR